MMEEIRTASASKLNLLTPEYSNWQCYLFGSGSNGLSMRPLKGQEPNWFWRKMQYLAFGNKWVWNPPA